MKTSINTERGNINVLFEEPENVEASPEWTIGDRRIQFAWIPPGKGMSLPYPELRTLVKVINGFLVAPERYAFCEPKGKQNTLCDRGEITAGEEGAFVTVVTEPNEKPIRTMEELQFSGPLAEALQWRTFHEQFGEFTNAFEGADAYVGPGFHLLCDTGEETCFLNIWTAGKGVDLTTHNHAHNPSPLSPAFAETHLVISNGTGSGGMYECAEPGAEKSRYPLPSGYEHGAFFDIDESTNLPVMRDNGAVSYPWHGWEAGSDDDPIQAYDLVFAFETLPSCARQRS